MIETKKDKKGTHIMLGNHRLIIATPETPQAAIDRFVELATNHHDKLALIAEERARCVKANHDSNGHGKDYPVFREHDRLISKLCREAGIIDS